MKNKEDHKNLMGKIPSYFTVLGIIIIILSLAALFFASKVLFF